MVPGDFVKWKHIPLSEEEGEGREKVCRTPEDVQIQLPGGSVVRVDAEVSDPDGFAGVTISLLEEGELTLAVRCSSGVVIKYITRANCEILLQVGNPG